MKTTKGIIWSAPSGVLYETLEPLLDAADLSTALAAHKRVLLKPNLVEALDPPITTPVGIIIAIIQYLRTKCPEIGIFVGEGTGSLEYDTFHCYERLDYMKLCDREGVELIDLNKEPSRYLRDKSCTRWPEMHLPERLFNSFLISVPVLKAHSLSGVTLTMKNMMGCAPPVHYQGGGAWGKSSFHRQIHEAIFDLNRYRTPDFTILDASVGMARAHLWGPTCTPPVGKVAVSYDPVAIDAHGATLLRKSWQKIKHIRMAHRLLGLAEPIDVREMELTEAT